MSAARPIEPVLHSDLPRGEFEALLQRFVAGLPDRLQQLEAAIQNENWEDVSKLSHQVRGAAGSYGYPPIAEEARKIEESAFSSKEQDVCRESLTRLERLCLMAQRALQDTFHTRS